MAKLLIWLLARSQQAEEDTVLLGMEKLGNLLEQYYHPSNNGRQGTSTFNLFLYRIFCISWGDEHLCILHTPATEELSEDQNCRWCSLLLRASSRHETKHC